MPGFDFANFRNTPLEELSNAVENDDSIKIENILNAKKPDINYLDPKFGQPLLTLALINNKISSAKILLEHGANVNIRAPQDNSSPFLVVCKYACGNGDSQGPNLLSLLIRYSADVNSIQDPKKGIVDSSRKISALQYLCRFGTVDCVKVLVENGARLDIYPKDGENSIICEASLNSRLDIMRYLLIDKEVAIPDYCVIREEGTKFERKINLREIILERKEAKDDHQQKLEDEILEFLKVNGHMIF